MKIAGLIVLTSVFNAAAAVVAVVVTLQVMSPVPAGPGGDASAGVTPGVAATDPPPTVASASTTAGGDQARVVRPTGPVVEPRTQAPAPRVQTPATPKPQPQPVAPPTPPQPQPQTPPLPAPQPEPESDPATEEATETVSVDDLPEFRYTEDDLVQEENLLIGLNANETELSKYRSLGVELIGLSDEIATLDKSIDDLAGNRLGQLRRTLLLGERESKLAHAHELQDSQIAISQTVRERNAKALAEAREKAQLEREQAAAARAQAQAAAEAQANADGNADDDGMTTAQANTEALSSGEDPTGLGAAVSDTARITDAIGGFASALEEKLAQMEQRQRQQQNPQGSGGSR